MSEIKDYFDGITTAKSADDIAKSVMERAEKCPERSGLRFQPLAVAAAAAVVLVGGVTAAAATGLIDFNDIFGGFMHSEDEVFANQMLACAENVEWTISDEAYELVLNGVAGTQYDMYANYEIVRKDGKPVTEFMTNIPEDGILVAIENEALEWRFVSDGTGKTCVGGVIRQCVINDDGNIEVFEQWTSDHDITGQRHEIEIRNVYPRDTFEDFRRRNNFTHPDFNDECGCFRIYGNMGDHKVSDVPINDERVIGLEIDWALSFDYIPTEEALASREIVATGKPVKIYLNEGGEGIIHGYYDILSGSLSSVGGALIVNEEIKRVVSSVAHEYTEAYVTTKDGGKHPVTITISDYDDTQHRMNVYFGESLYSEINVIDVDSIESFTINGETFPLA